MACMASKKVQKYRSRIKAAMRSMVPSSTGAGSSTDRSCFKGLSGWAASSADRMTPSVRRLPCPKGTATRTPGTAPSERASGTW